MPFKSERITTLEFIENMVYRLIVSQSLYTDDDIEFRVIEEEIQNLISMKFMILSCRFFGTSEPIPKSHGFRELLWLLPETDFKQECRMNKESFAFIISMIEDHQVFQNNSQNPQIEVAIQLAVTLERLGNFGNGKM
jgi:hypothetical protein